jgi:carboxypeptidase Q
MQINVNQAAKYEFFGNIPAEILLLKSFTINDTYMRKPYQSFILPFPFIIIVLLGLSCQPQSGNQGTEASSVDEEDARMIKMIFDEALANGKAYGWLEHLCKEIGPRLAGSENSLRALDWTEKIMQEEGFDQVFRQEVMVPHWERGAKEVARIIGSGERLNALALGGSIGTGASGIQGEVIEVQSLDEVDELGEKVKGKIVFYNRAFDQRNVSTGAGYGGAVDQRSRGAIRAGKYGAIGVVIRSVTSAFDDAPHTGAMNYDDDIEKIPAAALGFQSADILTEALKNGPVELFLKMNCQWFPDAKSANVIGQIEGSEKPEEYIIVGGHIDSWDVGEGAHDDGAGCMHSIEALRILKEIGYEPRHSLRAVMFMNEENGVRGGAKYAEIAKSNNDKHILAIESDAGGFSPRGFGISGADASLEKLRGWLPLFPQNTISFINKGGGGVDVGPLHRETQTPMMGLGVDPQRMFDVHHSPNDVFETVHRRELHLGAASLAAMIYLVDKYGL